LKIDIANYVFPVRWDGMQDWVGEAIYADAKSAHLWVPEEYKEWMREGDPDYIPGVFSWVEIGKYMWHLYEDDSPVGIVVTKELVYKVDA